MTKQSPCYYVLEIPTEGVVAGEKPAAYVRGVHASNRIATQQARALQDGRTALCCYRYQAMARTLAETRYNLAA